MLALLGSSSLFADSGQASQTNFTSLLVWVGFAIFFFYFILYRPEQKRRKKALQMRASMKKGDKVTAMGIVGVISQVKEDTVILKMVDGAKVEMLKGAITEITSVDSDTATAS